MTTGGGRAGRGSAGGGDGGVGGGRGSDRGEDAGGGAGAPPLDQDKPSPTRWILRLPITTRSQALPRV
jgi:hypothetical protein